MSARAKPKAPGGASAGPALVGSVVTPTLPMDESVFFKLVRVVNLTARPFQEGVGRAHHLSLNEWRCLLVLASHPGIAATDVAEQTGLDKMSVSRALAGLAKHARIDRRPDPKDQRRALVDLTEKGQALFDAIAPTARQREAHMFAALSPFERDAMSLALDKLLRVV